MPWRAGASPGCPDGGWVPWSCMAGCSFAPVSPRGVDMGGSPPVRASPPYDSIREDSIRDSPHRMSASQYAASVGQTPSPAAKVHPSTEIHCVMGHRLRISALYILMGTYRRERSRSLEEETACR